jgi:hypothetical protein
VRHGNAWDGVKYCVRCEFFAAPSVKMAVLWDVGAV